MSIIKELIEIYNSNKLLRKSEQEFINDAQPLLDKYIDDRVKLILNGLEYGKNTTNGIGC